MLSYPDAGIQFFNLKNSLKLVAIMGWPCNRLQGLPPRARGMAGWLIVAIVNNTFRLPNGSRVFNRMRSREQVAALRQRHEELRARKPRTRKVGG